MAKRKIRTREHIIADLSVNHFERHALLSNFSVERIERDYGYDLLLFTYQKNGEIENGNVTIQLKATDGIKISTAKKTISFSVDKRDLNLWLKQFDPVMLVVYDAKKNKGYWLYLQAYFSAIKNFKLKSVGKSKTVNIPVKNVVTKNAMEKFAQYKKALYAQLTNIKHTN